MKQFYIVLAAVVSLLFVGCDDETGTIGVRFKVPIHIKQDTPETVCKKNAINEENRTYKLSVEQMKQQHELIRKTWKSDLQLHRWHTNENGIMVECPECANSVTVGNTETFNLPPVTIGDSPQVPDLVQPSLPDSVVVVPITVPSITVGVNFSTADLDIISQVRAHGLNTVDGPRRAVLFGDNFTGTPAELHQCQNDMKKLAIRLVKLKGFKPTEIVLLYDRDCTRENYLKFGAWALANAQDDDERFIADSSHGAEDTTDGAVNDVIVTFPMVSENRWDATTEVTVNEWHDVLTANVNPHLNWCFLGDFCHSGGAIKPTLRRGYKQRTIAGPAFVVERVSKSQVVSVNKLKAIDLGGSVGLACKDNELSEENQDGGLFIEAFCQAWDQHPTWTFSALMKDSYTRLRARQATQTPVYRGQGVGLPIFVKKP